MKQRQSAKSAFDLIEEATHALRTAPIATLAAYYLGTIPFALGFLFFWADMSRSPFANQHLADASFVVTLLFLWMKFWQTIFARCIRAQFAAATPQINFRRALKFFVTQTIFQSFGLIFIPLAALPVIPFPWVYAFFQNVTVLDSGDESTFQLFKKSRMQAALWPRQFFLLLAIMAVFAFVIFLNWAIVCLMLPGLFKMFFGIDSIFAQSSWAMLNTTFFAAMFALTYLCVDPILKTIFALRCFYGESLQSGEDLKGELKLFLPSAQKAAV